MTNKLRHLTDLRDMRDHFRSEMSSWAYEAPGERITLRMRLTSLRFVLACRFNATVCEFRGHDYEPDGADYIDSGGEGFSCARCGHSFTAWH